jgi:anti-sigma factor RsiW
MATEEFMDRSLQHAFDAEEVMAYLDGELEPQRAARLASHLEHCAECQGIAREMRTVSGRMLNFEIEPMPERVTAAVVAELNSPTKPEPVKVPDVRRKMWAKWHELAANRKVWGFAAAFAVVAMAIAIGSVSNLRRSREAANLVSGRVSELQIVAAEGRRGVASLAASVDERKHDEHGAARRACSSCGSTTGATGRKASKSGSSGADDRADSVAEHRGEEL